MDSPPPTWHPDYVPPSPAYPAPPWHPEADEPPDEGEPPDGGVREPRRPASPTPDASAEALPPTEQR